jgi:hypothetical protein
MKLIDYAKPSSTPGFLQQLIERLPTWLLFKSGEQIAHERLVARLQRDLDNRFLLVKNLPLGSTPELTPYILIGPAGLIILNVSTQRGIYRARDESWWEMSKTSRKYQPARRNLIRQTLGLVQRLQAYLEKQSFTCPAILPVLLFIDPGVHVETSRPAVRIVLTDGIRNLIANLLQSDEMLSPGQIRTLADLLDRTARPQQVQDLLKQEEDFFGKDLIQPEEKPATKTPTPVPQLNLPPVLEKMGLSRGQWIMVSILVVITMLVLGGLIFLVLFTA